MKVISYVEILITRTIEKVKVECFRVTTSGVGDILTLLSPPPTRLFLGEGEIGRVRNVVCVGEGVAPVDPKYLGCRMVITNF